MLISICPVTTSPRTRTYRHRRSRCRNKPIRPVHEKIKGLDLSNGFGVMLALYKGTVLIGNSSTKAKGIYSLDIQTGEVSKEPILTTVGNPILCHYFDK